MNRTSEMEHILICLKEHIALSDDEDNLLLDYIINLQKENEDYKSRVEKAVKYNYELQERYCHSALYDELVASKIYEITEKELNILQNGSDASVKD